MGPIPHSPGINRSAAVPVPSRSLPLWFHLIDRLAVEPGSDIGNHAGIEHFIIVQSRIAEMWRGYDIAQFPERMIQRQRLLVESVDTGATDLLVLQGRNQRAVIHALSPRGVDQVSRRLHK